MGSLSGINPKILRWARETAGLSTRDIANLIRKPYELIEKWESGETVPTYGQLEKLAYQIYKRPIALFFFPEPPDEPDPKKSFRTLPEFEIANLSADTRYAIRQAKAMQLALNELNDGVNPSPQKIFRDVKVSIKHDVKDAALEMRSYLGIQIKDQISWKRNEDALRNWKNAVEDKGIFIFKRAFDQKGISGFCLSDEEFPVIYVNNGTSMTRQIFTILHELSHVLLNVNGITLRDDSFIDALLGDEKGIEVFSNRFTGEILVPMTAFEQQLLYGDLSDESIGRIAKRFKVSREVILRKLLDMGKVSRNYYESKAKEWSGDYERRAGTSKGGNYYATQVAYLGEKFLGLAFGRYYKGKCTFEELANYLNVKAKNIPTLEQLVLTKHSPYEIRI